MAEVAVPQVFTRRASGLGRVMSPYSAFVYNILTMGVIFPWTYLWAPTAFQGSNLVLGIAFAFLFELPIALAYTWLATALPRSGGDYERDHHHQPRERGDRARASRERVPQLRSVPVRDVVRDPGVLRDRAALVPHHEPCRVPHEGVDLRVERGRVRGEEQEQHDPEGHQDRVPHHVLEPNVVAEPAHEKHERDRRVREADDDDPVRGRRPCADRREGMDVRCHAEPEERRRDSERREQPPRQSHPLEDPDDEEREDDGEPEAAEIGR